MRDWYLEKAQFEKRFIMDALQECEGMINRTAVTFNIPKKTMLRKIVKYDIDVSLFKKKKPITFSVDAQGETYTFRDRSEDQDPLEK